MEEKKKKLNTRQERFCQLYVSKEFFCNGVQSYSEAYNKPMTTKKEYNVCKVGAWENLTKPNIIERIDELIEKMNLNDCYVDKQLGKLITQEVDFKSKLGAIKEYNLLKKRITKNIDLTSGGEKIGGIEYITPKSEDDKKD